MAKRILLAICACVVSIQAWAVPFENIRIGEQDGFGYVGGAAGFNGANGLAADANGNGILEPGELLPDLNGDTVVSTTFFSVPAGGFFLGFDEFDNRQSEGISCVGCVDIGTAGAEFTDISLATSYDPLQDVANTAILNGDPVNAFNGIYDANTNTFGAGGDFPFPDSTDLPIQPGFVFDFTVGEIDIDPSQDIFFNLIFGDYDVFPAELLFTRADSTTFVQNLFLQEPDADGLIQAAFATLSFADVFSGGGGSDFSGFLRVDFVAPLEPYTAFDFVELSTRPIISVPEPGSLGLLAMGLLGLRVARRKRLRRSSRPKLSTTGLL